MTDVNPIRSGTTSSSNSGSAAVGDCWATIRPLTRVRKDGGTPYVREPSAEKQLRALCALDEKARRARLTLPDRGAEGFVGEEALVYAIRTYHMAGDEDAAWSLADLLTERVAGHVRREMDKWRLTPDEADECARDLFAALFEALFDLGPAGEFWEVRFWVCLDRRLWNLLERRQAQADLQTSPMDEDGGPAGATEMREDPLARLADTDAVNPERRAELQEALALLTENERLAVYLCRVEGWPEESDDPDRPSAARALGVTGRSVRNYLRRAETKLLAWEQSGKDI
jgi:DNA-directed RNA polymerase specialized sigma24 family protein